MKCIYCNSELPSKANFCPKCLRQIACLSCKEALVRDTSICVYCGKTITQNNSTNAAVNNIEFSDNGNERTFRASFTDTVAGNVVETFANLLPFQKQSYTKELVAANVVEDKTIEDVEHTEISTDKRQKSDDLTTLEKIFKNKDGEISLYDPRIKAKNKSDFVSRISLLYLYYKELQGEQETNRADLNNFLKQEKIDEKIFRVWLSTNKKLIDNKKTYLCLRLEGQETAQQILTEFLDNSIPNTYELKGNFSKSKKEETKNTTNGKSKNKPNTTTYKIVPDLNLKPSNKKSLIDFYAEYSVKKSAAEHNLFFIYYLERILEEKDITINHVYTCYKAVKKQFPNNLYQSLVDTKNRNGWIDTSNTNNLKIITAGENYLEHDMVKK